MGTNKFFYFILTSRLFKKIAMACFSNRTRKSIEWDIRRLGARVNNNPSNSLIPSTEFLHFGCGGRIIGGWINVDIENSDFNIDLACGHLPWKDNVFQAAVGQHVIEHCDISSELLPLLKDIKRVLKPDGEIWISCPDIKKVCRSYLENGMTDLVEGRKVRFPNFSLGVMPSSQMINDLFHQDGEHKNLFDFELLRWVLESAGFFEISEVEESDFLARFPMFPVRGDEDHTLYVKASKMEGTTSRSVNRML